MEALFGHALGTGTIILLGCALLLALSFEFVNGFHDTANAVATVVYTHALRPTQAVVWSGFCNFLGAVTSTGAVAFGIVALLPVELIVNVGSGAGVAMVFALLVSAIVWNIGTWYLGLPASSSHTLIGSIVGVGLMNSWLSANTELGEGVNWGKVGDTALSLLISPAIGFVCAALLLLLARALLRNPALYQAPVGKQPPPLPIRILLVLTCTGVSFAHGSNDGQKGMGLIMLVLIGIVPSIYALNLDVESQTVARLAQSSRASVVILERLPHAALATEMSEAQAQEALSLYLRKGKVVAETEAALLRKTRAIERALTGVNALTEVPEQARAALRSDVFLVAQSLGKMAKAGQFHGADKDALLEFQAELKQVTTFIPTWVKAAVALALGLGTMVGWKRIAITVGERIGKVHLTYAQGAAAELVAMATISVADRYGLPVSTTHVLSSGIAGTMVANRSGVQRDVVRKILLAWALTLPVCMFLGATLFAAALFIVLRLVGVH